MWTNLVTRSFTRCAKPTVKFASKFTSDTQLTQSHFRVQQPQYSAAGWCIAGGLPKNLFRPGQGRTNFKGPPQFCQQPVRSFRHTKVPGPVKERITVRSSQKSGFGPPAPDRNPELNMSDRLNLIFKPLGFVALVGASSFVACTIWKYEQYRMTLTRDKWFSPGSWRIPNLGPGEPQTVITSLGMRFKAGSIRDKINTWWSQVPSAERVFWGICGLNFAVFCAWRIPSITPRMITYFTASPNSRALCWPMLLSTFSHYSFYHFAINMFVLHSFMPAAINALGKEQFLSMYLTTGVVSSFGSHVQKLMMGITTPSLGASGAIMGVLALVCTKFPEIQLGIVFIPGLSFSADTALKCIIAVDSVGILAGWKFIDHAAHLSGTLFGIAYSKYGHHLSPMRDFVMETWHDIRNKTAS